MESEVEFAIRQIILRRRLECEKQLNNSLTKIDGPYCPGIFDDWSCWNDTPANTTAETKCPFFIAGFDETRKAYKYCDESGNWYRHPSTNRTWTNYSSCVDTENLKWHESIIIIYEIGYSVSLVALVLSLAILWYFRNLRCARITLHMNLFTSFLINNALWIIWYRCVVRRPTVIADNKPWCQFLHVIINYFLLTNYSWMLCEGFYLHTILISAFVSEERLLNWLIFLGWGTPAITVIIYASARASDSTASHSCWIYDSPYSKIIIVPGFITMILNVLFLCNIVRVLLIKLRGMPHIQTTVRPSRTLQQALRATLLLVPLLGLHFLLTPFRPEENHPWAKIYEVTLAVSASFQGFCVAVLFCFCNGEVVAQVRRKWRDVMFRPRTNLCTTTAISENAPQEYIKKYVRSTATPLASEERV